MRGHLSMTCNGYGERRPAPSRQQRAPFASTRPDDPLYTRWTDQGADVMASSDDPGIPVADAIELLRDELEAALRKGAGRPVQFGVSDVTLTVNVVASKSKDAAGKVRWWVVEAGG